VTAFDDLGTSRVVAAADNVEVAWAAYSAAIPKQARGGSVLHQQARIIARTPQRLLDVERIEEQTSVNSAARSRPLSVRSKYIKCGARVTAESSGMCHIL
jgi:hypothetical protein